MRIAYLVELVVTCAAGLAVARWELGDLKALGGGISRMVFEVEWWARAGSGFLTGLGAAGFVGLAVEVARGRAPRPWGLGRWAWSLVGLWLVARPLFSLASDVAYWLRGGGEPWRVFLGGLPDTLRGAMMLGAWRDPFCLVIALALVRRMASPGPVATDAREWAGRGFAIGAALVGLGVDEALRFLQ